MKIDTKKMPGMIMRGIQAAYGITHPGTDEAAFRYWIIQQRSAESGQDVALLRECNHAIRCSKGLQKDDKLLKKDVRCIKVAIRALMGLYNIDGVHRAFGVLELKLAQNLRANLYLVE